MSIARSFTVLAHLAAIVGAAGMAGVGLAAECRAQDRAGPPHAGTADLAFVHATVWTVDDSKPRAEAVAISGDRFLRVGTDAEVLRVCGPDTEVVDLHGAFVVPGFNDTHVHFASAARFLEFNVMTASTQAEFVDSVRDAVSRVPKGEWILGGFWGAYDQWAIGSAGGESHEPFEPDMRAIAELTAEHPMFIHKFDNSAYAANAAALRELGMDPDDLPAVPGVEFARDAEGRATGVLRGPGAGRLFGRREISRFTRARRIAQTKHALAEIARRGVTSISDMSDDEQLDIWRELRARGELGVRVDFRYGLDRWRVLAEQGIRAGPGDPWIRLGGLKGHIDGIMGTSSARFFEPYANDPGNRGRWRPLMVAEDGAFVEGKFLGYLLDADRAGLQITVHAIGDEANNLLLDYLDQLAQQNGERDRRFRLVHAQVIAPGDLPRLGALGVLAEVQPFHLADDMRWMEERIGRARCAGAYAFRSIRDSGALLCFGSDWPGTSASAYPIDPMLGLYAAVTRQTLAGAPADGWFPAERISIEDAIRAYTQNDAFSTYEEDRKGSITEGKLADLVVLSQNLLECEPRAILETKVLRRVLGGK